MKRLSREQLVTLVHEVMSASACRGNFDSLLQRLEAQAPALDVGRMIFSPTDGRPLTPEEIVDQIMASDREADRL